MWPVNLSLIPYAARAAKNHEVGIMLTDPKLRPQVDALRDKFWMERPATLSEPPLDMFGADAVERWFTEREVEEVVEFANKMAV